MSYTIIPSGNLSPNPPSETFRERNNNSGDKPVLAVTHEGGARGATLLGINCPISRNLKNVSGNRNNCAVDMHSPYLGSWSRNPNLFSKWMNIVCLDTCQVESNVVFVAYTFRFFPMLVRSCTNLQPKISQRRRDAKMCFVFRLFVQASEKRIVVFNLYDFECKFMNIHNVHFHINL